MEELVAVLNADGDVVRAALRSEVRRDNLRHAATAVLVRDPDGRVYVTRRSPDKDWAPSLHDATAGGVVTHGEQAYDSAQRELAEELGIEGVELRALLTHRYEDDQVRSVLHCFETMYDGPVRHADGEVVWGTWMSLEELGSRLRDPQWPFVPDTRSLLERLCREQVGDYALLGLGADQVSTTGGRP